MILFNKATLVGDELAYVADSMRSGRTTSSGPYTERAAGLVRSWLDAEDVLLTTSCTAALELSALLLDFEPGDAVIVPSFTFPTTALAFARAGAELIFCDIEEETLGLDPDHVAALLDLAESQGVRVRAVVAVHYAGIACRLEPLQTVLAAHPGVDLIEDNAHGLGGRHHDTPLGSFGRFSAHSFHATKNFSCGEGGALVLNRAADVDRARVLYDKGTNRRAFMAGQVDKYSWTDTGSSFGLSDILAAHLLGQLEKRDEIQARRARIWNHYREQLDDLEAHGVGLPVVPAGAVPAWHLFHLLLPTRAERDRALRELNDGGVMAVFHYVPLHSSHGGQRFLSPVGKGVECPVADRVSGTLLRLPLHLSLSESDVTRVTKLVSDVVTGASAARP